MFLVESCEATYGGAVDTYWQFEPSTSPSPVGRLQYGDLPSGYRAIHSARPLTEGCYSVAFGGKDELYIIIAPDGRVSRITQGEARRRTRN